MALANIPFTQFLLPGGRRRAAEFPASHEIAQVAAELIADGHEFQAEILTTGEVSLTCFNGEEDIAIEICPNGPEVPVAVEKLVRAAKSGEPHVPPR